MDENKENRYSNFKKTFLGFGRHLLMSHTTSRGINNHHRGNGSFRLNYCQHREELNPEV